MSPNLTILQNAVHSKDHTTLLAAVRAAGLTGLLSGPGPITVFAPTNAAFARLPPGVLATLMKPANSALLVKTLSYHALSGRLTSAGMTAAIGAGHGQARLTTLEGEPVVATLAGGRIRLTDVRGHMATITIADVAQSNGVIHVVDTVLTP